MELTLIIIATGIISTLAMTMFSYLLSALTHNKFEEPQLINILFKRAQIFSFNLYREHILGWLIHFSIGILFVLSFMYILSLELLSNTLLSGIIFGFIAGVLGAIIWGTVLKIHPNPPKINRVGFLFQLIPAHIIFGVVMVLLLSNI